MGLVAFRERVLNRVTARSDWNSSLALWMVSTPTGGTVLDNANPRRFTCVSFDLGEAERQHCGDRRECRDLLLTNEVEDVAFEVRDHDRATAKQVGEQALTRASRSSYSVSFPLAHSIHIQPQVKPNVD
jgi:hypothetical protein